jgi:RimJ/RimL family protein N-acetyltransferase
MSFMLESDRLCIRRFQDSDFDPFWKYRNDPEVARYQGWELPYSREKAQEFIVEMKVKRLSMQGEWFQAAVEDKISGEMLGDVAFYLKKGEPQAYIGYTIARPHWRKGYGLEATHCLLVYLFGELDLHRVIAVTDVENIASSRMLERMGFRREAHFIENLIFKGAWASEYYYAMLKREWESLAIMP